MPPVSGETNTQNPRSKRIKKMWRGPHEKGKKVKSIQNFSLPVALYFRGQYTGRLSQPFMDYKTMQQTEVFQREGGGKQEEITP